MKKHKTQLESYDQIDLFNSKFHDKFHDKFDDNFDDQTSSSLIDELSFDPWDSTRGRNIIKAQGKKGKDIKFYFDALDQQYHLFED